MLVSVLLSLLPQAKAAVTPVWNWPVDKPVFYHLETALVTPRGTLYRARQNLETRAQELDIVADTSCQAAPEGKNLLKVTCTFAWLTFSGRDTNPAEQEQLDRILAEWSTDVAKASVQMIMDRNGKVKEFDLVGLKGANQRESGIIQAQRVTLQRAFSLLDLPFPTDPNDWIRGWEVKNVPPLLQLPVTSGTAGACSVKHTAKGEKDYPGYYTILTSGKATLSPGSAVDSSAVGTLMYDVRFAGSAEFDLAAGVLAYRDINIYAYRTTASSDSGNDAEYAQLSAVQKVDAFLPNGQAPLSIAAQHAVQLAGTPPPPPEGVPVVAFAELGMQPLFVPSMPAAGKELQLPTTTMGAQVVVGPTGKPTAVEVYKGYSALSTPTHDALMGAQFPVRAAAPYVVLVDVEFRP